MKPRPLAHAVRVRILNGRTVRRVGYPLGLEEAYAALGFVKVTLVVFALRSVVGDDRRVSGFPEVLGGTPLKDLLESLTRPEREVVRATLYAYCKRNHFGGSARVVLFDERPELVGLDRPVWGLFRKQVGTHYSGCSASSWGDPSGEGPSFAPSKTLAVFKLVAPLPTSVTITGSTFLHVLADDCEVIEWRDPIPRSRSRRKAT